MSIPTARSRLGGAPTTFGGDFRATNLDLLLASLIALGLPLATSWLYTATGGATASLILYYVVCCVVIVLWRKRTLDYQWPARWPWLLFGLSLLLPLANAALNWGTLPNAHAPLWGLLVTALLVTALLDAGFAVYPVYPVNPKTLGQRRNAAGAKTDQDGSDRRALARSAGTQ
jgi:hypothetical protein